MLGVIAKVTGQFQDFSVHLGQRQGTHTQFGAVNQRTVLGALSQVVGAPSPPNVKAGTRSLMAAPNGLQEPPTDGSNIVPLVPAGTKSLLAPK